MKKYIESEIKKLVNRIQLLTNSGSDKELKEVLILNLRNLQKDLQVYL